MVESLSVTADPGLSPQFDKARGVSRVMTVILATGFWVTMVWASVLPVLLGWPGVGGWGDAGKMGMIIAPASLSFGARAGVILAIQIGAAPLLLVLHHAGRVFASFARGQVFVPATTAHIRAAGLWLVMSGLASAVERVLFNLFAGIRPVAQDLDLKPILIVFGVAVYVAAYVMAEAQRLAEDNAAIV